MRKNKKILGFVFVALVARLLSAVVFEEIRTVIDDVTREYSVTEFVKTVGIHRSSLIIISAFDVAFSRYQAKSFLSSCNCSRKFSELPGVTKRCSLVEIPIDYPMVIDNKNVNFNSSITILEAPSNFKDGENIPLNCLTSDR